MEKEEHTFVNINFHVAMFYFNEIIILFSSLGLMVTILFVYLVISLSMLPQEAKRHRIDDLLRAGVNIKRTAETVDVSLSTV